MNKNEKKEDSFVFYPSFLAAIEAIKNESIRLYMLEAVVNYGVYGTLPDFAEKDPNGILDAMFTQMQFIIDDTKSRRATNRENGLKKRTGLVEKILSSIN